MRGRVKQCHPPLARAPKDMKLMERTKFCRVNRPAVKRCTLIRRPVTLESRQISSDEKTASTLRISQLDTATQETTRNSRQSRRVSSQSFPIRGQGTRRSYRGKRQTSLTSSPISESLHDPGARRSYRGGHQTSLTSSPTSESLKHDTHDISEDTCEAQTSMCTCACCTSRKNLLVELRTTHNRLKALLGLLDSPSSRNDADKQGANNSGVDEPEKENEPRIIPVTTRIYSQKPANSPSQF